MSLTTGQDFWRNDRWGEQAGERLGRAIPGLVAAVSRWLKALFKPDDSAAEILAYGQRYDDPWWLGTRPIRLEHVLNLHMAVFGEPGSGKSNFEQIGVEQCIKTHRPFIQFDSHNLTEKTIPLLIHYGWRPEEVCIADLVDRRHGSLGAGAIVEPGQEPCEGVEGLLMGFRAHLRDSWGPRTEDIMRHEFLALHEVGGTVAEAVLFLTSEPFRIAVVRQLKNPDVRAFWTDHFGGMKPSEQRFIVEAPRNKLSALLAHPALRDIFSQNRSTIPFDEILRAGPCRAALITFNQARLGDHGAFAAALLLCKLMTAIRSRPSDQSGIVTVFCDEAADYFVPEFCLAIARGARKFGISYRAFLQSPLQLQEHADLLLETCATHVAFALARKGAERMARELFSFDGRKVKYQPEDDLHGRPQFFSVGEEYEHAVQALTTQKVGEGHIRMRGAQDTGMPYAGTVPEVRYPAIEPERIEAFRAASAAVYCTPTARIEQERAERLRRFLGPGRGFATEE